MPLPDSIVSAPQLHPGLNLFYTAFLDLTSCRTPGPVVNPITWLDIHYYCQANDIVEEQREDVFYHVTRLDKAYLDWSNKKPPPPAPPAPQKPAPQPRQRKRR